MKLNRREFLSLSGKSAAGAVIFAACSIPEQELLVQSPVDMPYVFVRGIDSWFATSWYDGGSVDDTTYKTYIHNAYVDLDEQGTTLYTQRSIGSDDKTYLIRDGSTVDAKGCRLLPRWPNLVTVSILSCLS